MDKLSPIQWALATAMSQVSEDEYCAGWLIGLEYILWEALLGKSKLTLNPTVHNRLVYLSELCGGWIIWEDGETYIPIKEWEELYAKYK